MNLSGGTLSAAGIYLPENGTSTGILNISEYTIKDHLKSILAKLRVADRTEAVTVAIQRGIIEL